MKNVLPFVPKSKDVVNKEVQKQAQKQAQVFPAIVISFVDVQNGPHVFVLNATRALQLAKAIQEALVENKLVRTETDEPKA